MKTNNQYYTSIHEIPAYNYDLLNLYPGCYEPMRRKPCRSYSDRIAEKEVELKEAEELGDKEKAGWLKTGINGLWKMVNTLESAWHKMQDEYLDEFGYNKEWTEAIELKRLASQLRTDAYRIPDLSLLTMATLRDAQADQLLISIEGGKNLRNRVGDIFVAKNIMVDVMTTSAYDFRCMEIAIMDAKKQKIEIMTKNKT